MSRCHAQSRSAASSVKAYVVAFVVAVGFSSHARADGFRAALTLSDGSRKQSAASDEAAREKGKPLSTRPTFEAGPDAKLRVMWKITRTANDPAKDVLVHFYVVKIARAGQAPPALSPKDVLLESALTMDFDPKTSSSAEMALRADQRGIYLVRVETEGEAGQTFAAMDLVVK